MGVGLFQADDFRFEIKSEARRIPDGPNMTRGDCAERKWLELRQEPRTDHDEFYN